MSVCASVAPAQAEPDIARLPSASEALAVLVDLPSPAARARRVTELVKRRDVSLDEWLVAMRAFAPWGANHAPTGEPANDGTSRHEVELWNGDALETTEVWLHVPAGLDRSEPAPLLLYGHGTGGTGRSGMRLWTDVAETLGMVVVGPSESGPNDGYRFSDREREIARSAIRWARRRTTIDPNRVFVTGISRGGHLAWDLALRQPDLAAAIAPMIGGPRLATTDGQNNLRYLENVAGLTIRDLQGSRDDPRMLFNLRLGFELLERFAPRDAKLIEFPELGHSFDFDAVDWVDVLGTARRDPLPDRVVRRAARADEVRAFWVEIASLDRDVREEFRPRVDARTWNRMDDAERRRWMQSQIDARTARLVVERDGPGRFRVVAADGVRRYRLLLTPDMIGEKGRIEIVADDAAKPVRRRVRPNKRVLLAEFAERFDPTFLPVADVVLPAPKPRR